MAALHVRLFGRFDLDRGPPPAPALHARRACELLSYLVLHRDHPQRREALAGQLWTEASPAQAAKYLRQALWQLQAALRPVLDGAAVHVLEVDPEWVQLNSCEELQADVIGFEAAARGCQGVPGAGLDEEARRRLESAVALYRGDLLEGWYQDWCLFERERLQNDFLDILEKLVCACESRRENELGLVHARRILAFDPAREQVHRHVMRLQQQAGNRTGALRAFQRCEHVLREELGVAPSLQTRSLYEAIRDGRAMSLEAPADTGAIALPANPQLPELAELLSRAQALFASIESRLRQEIVPPGPSADKPD
ncbi:MAG: BTAD domain-containing putative transcriptional regulator [Pseudomonadota bacterium]